MVRAYLSALENQLQRKVGSSHPLLRWLFEHAANVLNKYSTNHEGVTPYASLHGRNSPERLIEFGEKLFYYVPKRARSKLCLRWRLGTYLGISPNSDECLVANIDGIVTKSRTCARVVELSRWDADMVVKVKSIPGQPIMAPNAMQNIKNLEEHMEPHVDADSEARDRVDVEDEPKPRKIEVDARITATDLRKYGFHPAGCPKCEDVKLGIHKGWFKPHNQECRLRIYLSWKESNDPKYRQVAHLFEERAATPASAGAEDLDLNRTPAADPAPPTPTNNPVPPNPLRSEPAGDDHPDDEPEQAEQSGHWDPEAHHPQQPSMAEQDAADPSMDMFFPDAEGDEDDFDDVMGGLEPEDFDDHMIDTLRIAGVAEDTAFSFIRALRSEKLAKRKQSTFVELYGQGSVCKEAEKSAPSLNLKGLNAFDLRTRKPDGTPWNFRKRGDRMLAREYIDEHKPDWIIGSPPCTSYCEWNRHLNYNKMDPAEVEKKIAKGMKHLSFCIAIDREQLRRGKHFLHEHPQTAVSWQETGVQKMSEMPEVSIVTTDQCMHGLLTKDKNGEKVPARKTTRFMTTSLQMANLLQTRCDKGNLHLPLEGSRCAEAAYYPVKLIRTILLRVRNTKDAEDQLRNDADD